MAFSLSNWFKGKESEDGSEPTDVQSPSAHAEAPPAPNPPPASVRTVTPTHGASQVQRPVSLRDPSARPATLTVAPAKLPQSGKVTPVLPPARKVSMGAGFPAPAAPVAPLQPAFKPVAPDVTVSLEIGDFLDRLPTNFLKGDPVDRQQKVAFEASELYSDLSKGRASVPASVIYRRCPEIFSRPVSDTEDVEVALPLQKLVEQMGMALSTRTDQVEEENVGEIETPFLKVAMEDNAQLPTAAGTTAGAIRPPAPAAFRPGQQAPAAETDEEEPPVRPHRPGQISTISPVKAPADLPPVPVAPPTAASTGPIMNGKRPPSTVRASVAGGKIRLSGPAVINRVTAVPNKNAKTPSPGDDLGTHSQPISLPGQAPSPSHQVSKKTQRIQIPPISLKAGPTASPRPGAVTPPSAPGTPPAGHGTEAVAGLRTGNTAEAPAPVTFRTSPPPAPARPVPSTFSPSRTPAFPPPSFPAAPPAAAVPAAPVPAQADHRKIELGLAAVLRGVPAAMLAVEPSSVPDDVRVSLPFGLIEPQLSLGRVTVGRDIFVAALPESHRGVFAGDDATSEIPIPLQEVFQNLPSNALTRREDQITEELGNLYPTPFSQKAEEDAQRFATSAAAPGVAPAPEPEMEAARVPVMDDAPPVVETPAAPTTELERDIPLDLVESATSESPIAAAPADAPVEAHGTSEGNDASWEKASESLPPALPEFSAIEPFAQGSDSTVPEHFVSPAAALPTTELVIPPLSTPRAETVPEVAAPAVEKSAPAGTPARAFDSVLQTLFMTEEELDAKTIVKLVCHLPSVTGCAVMFEDGLRLAGNFPDGDSQGFSAMAAPFFKRAARFVSELELGGLQTFTLHTENGLYSFLMHDNICVSVRHTGRGFLPGVREKLEVVTRELARIYATSKAQTDAE